MAAHSIRRFAGVLPGAVALVLTLGAAGSAHATETPIAAVDAPPDTPAAAPVDAPTVPESNIRWPRSAAPALTPIPPPAATTPAADAPPTDSNIRLRPAAASTTTDPGVETVDDSNIHWRRTSAATSPAPVSPAATDAVESPASSVPAITDAFDQALAAYRRSDDAQRYVDAARLFALAAQTGSVRASAALGYLEALGYGVARDALDGRRRLQAASTAGLARADYLLALVAHEAGDAAQETALRESAARRGDAVAQNAMGVHYAQAGDRTTAELWFRRAADAGSAAARYNLASAAATDRTKPANSANQQVPADAAAAFERAQRYHRGEDVQADYAQALRYYRAAAARGHAGARRMLGLIQSRPGPAGAVDPSWMRQLAQLDVVHDTRGAAVASTARPLRLDDPLAGFGRLSPR